MGTKTALFILSLFMLIPALTYGESTGIVTSTELHIDGGAGEPAKIHHTWTNLGTIEQLNTVIAEGQHTELPDKDAPIIIYTTESSLEQARLFRKRLKRLGKTAEVYIVPEALNEELGGLAAEHLHQTPLRKDPGTTWERIKQKAKSFHVTPTKQDVAMGVIMASFKGVAGSLVWFSFGLPPAVPTAIVTFQVAMTFFYTTWLPTVDNTYALTPHGQETAKMTMGEFLRRQAHGLFVTQLVRLMSGPVGTAHSALSLIGQKEIFAHQFAGGTTGSLTSMLRAHRLSKTASRWVNFNLFMAVILLTLADQAGIHGAELFHWKFIKIHTSTLALIGANVGLGVLIAAFSKKVEQLAQKQEAWLNRKIEKVDNALNRLKSKGIIGCRGRFASLINRFQSLPTY